MKSQTKNGLILLAVVFVVGGVAWFRSAREGSNAGSPTAPAAEGGLSPGGLPTGAPGATPTTDASLPVAHAAAAKKLPRVVDVGADKCIPCKQMAPILVELRKEYEGRVIVEFVDVWKNPNAGDPYGIRTIPTQVFFDANGNEVWRHEGFLSKAEFVAKFGELGVK